VSTKTIQIIIATTAAVVNYLMTVSMICYKERRNSDDYICLRGLEHMISKDVTLECKARRNSVVHGVLAEQQRQQKDGVNHPVLLRKHSLAISKSSKLLALQLVTDDAAYVHKNVMSLILFQSPPYLHKHRKIRGEATTAAAVAV
jgi:hypothetical protein